MFGAAAIDLAYVAAGHTDAAILDSNKPWDTAAGSLLVREAGATITDFHSAAHTITSANVIAAAPAIADQLYSIIRT